MITSKSYQLLSEIVVKNRMTLSHLNFEGQDMGDDSCHIICELIQKIGSVIIINLSKNNISCIGAEYISQMIRRRDLKLRAILLNWNKIMGKGSIQLASAIEDNSLLQILDCSFNSFGSGQLKVKGVSSSNKIIAVQQTNIIKTAESLI